MPDFSLSGLVVTAVHGSNRDAKEIPPGASFEIQARGLVINTAPGITTWSISMTVFDITHNKAIGHKNDSIALGGRDNFALALNVLMPASATRYRVKIFATQTTTSQSPDKSRW